MRFIILASLIGLMTTSAAAAACRCNRVSNPGLYCGYCEAVKSPKDHYHAYECSRTGACHDYGDTIQCNRVSTSPLYCDGRDHWKRDLEGSLIENVEARDADPEAEMEQV